MGSHSLLVARERLTMHLSWILIVFQIISSQIYGIHTSNYRANLTPSTVPRHFTLYETENDTSNGVFKNLELFKKTVTNAISRMTNMIGIPRIESRQDVGSFFLAILIGGIFPLLGFIAIQLQESSSSSSKSKSRFPVDCVWNSWSPCSRTCGGGTQTRDVLQVDKDGGIPCVGPTLNHCNLQACPQVVAAAGQRGSVQGNLRIGGTRRRRGWAIFGKDDIKNILKEAFCDNIISGSIVTGSCDLQVLDYNTVTGLAKYILSFEILDAIALEKSLYIINRDIATNTAITASGQSALPGTIVGASELVQGHLEMFGLDQNLRPRKRRDINTKPGTVVGASTLVQGQMVMSGLGQNWRARTGDACACPVDQTLVGDACACPVGQSLVGDACAYSYRAVVRFPNPGVLPVMWWA